MPTESANMSLAPHAGHPLLLKVVQPLPSRLGKERLVEDGLERRVVELAVDVPCVLRVGDELGLADRLGELAEGAAQGMVVSEAGDE